MRHKSIFVFTAIILVLIVVAGFSYQPIFKNINLGLDLRGGLHVLLEAKDSPGAKVTEDAMNSATGSLRNRIDKFGVSEPLIQRQGKNRIIVELAGIKDPEGVVNTILKPAYLEIKDQATNGKTIISGKDLIGAKPTIDSNGQAAISFSLNKEGAKKFGDFTARNVGKNLYTFIDGNLIQTATIESPILAGEGQITGMKDNNESKRISELLNSGALPVKLLIKEKRVVGPTLGKDSLDKSTKAGIIGIIAILLFMALYYKVPGLVADFALIVYSFLLLSMLAGFHAVLTLPGIAGFLLSIGVAVDSNVIIFERIKEELRSGKTLRSAIDAGFNRAFVTIIDSNMVHIISGIILYYFGTGPIKGFAVTLLLGVVASIVTAVFLTRYLMRLLADSKFFTNHKLYGA